MNAESFSNLNPEPSRIDQPAPWIPWAFWIFGVIASFWPALLSGFKRLQIDPYDVRLINAILEQGYQALFGRIRFWDPPYFHPVRNVAGYTETLLGTGPAYWIWRLLGLAPDVSAQLWAISVTSLNFLVAYLWLRRDFSAGRLSAAAGAYLFAFANSRLGQHPQMAPHFFSLLMLMALVRIFRFSGARTSALWIPVACLSLVAQIYAGFYLGWFAILAVFLAAAVAALFKREWRESLVRSLYEHRLSWIASGVLTLLLIYPMLSHYLAAARELGERAFHELRMGMPRPQTWIFLGNGSWPYAWMSRVRIFQLLPAPSEQSMGLGLITTVLATRALWMDRRRPSIAVLSLTALLLIGVTTLWLPHVSAWYAFYSRFPGAKAIRSLSRIGLMLLVPAALGVSLAVETQLRKGARWTALLLAALVAGEQLRIGISMEREPFRREVSAIVRELRATPCRYFFVSLKGGSPYDPSKHHVDAMLAALETGIPTLNGYSGNYPPGWFLYNLSGGSPAARETEIRSWLDRWIAEKKLDPAGLCWIKRPLSESP